MHGDMSFAVNVDLFGICKLFQTWFFYFITLYIYSFGKATYSAFQV